jgi:hypothetical protein
MHHRQLRSDPLEPMLFEREVAKRGRDRSKGQDAGAVVMDEAIQRACPRPERSPGLRCLLDYPDLNTLRREPRGANEPRVAGSNYHGPYAVAC